MRQVGEPRVEDILASIKRVIAREDRSLARGEGPPAVEPEAVAPDANPEDGGADGGDVLNLGDSDLARPDAALDIGESQVEAPDLASNPVPLPVAESTRASMRDSFETLTLAAEGVDADPAMQAEQVRAGEAALEALVREMLRPQLAEWLDRRLPAIVEQLVASEISRITGKRG